MIRRSTPNSSEISPRIAVLMTCFNRKETTLRCLKELASIPNILDVYLVDDNSSDQSAETIEKHYPDVRLIHGNGNLFWNRGMHLAWKTALVNDYDYYILLNDDVCIFPNTVLDLINDSHKCDDKSIISGAVQDSVSGEPTYGGRNPETGLLAVPDGTLKTINNINGNVLFVPRFVVNTIGILDPFYQHHFGDVDYGLTAQEHNIKVFLSSHYSGTCKKNPICRIRLFRANVIRRFKFLFSPLGTPPSSVYHFFQKHGKPIKGILFIGYLIMINCIPDWLYKSR